jgi:RNA polymerase sigma-70 factor, ECF subfamily
VWLTLRAPDTELTEVARKVMQGDREAFRVIVERTQRGLFRLGARMLGNTTEAEDVLQETFLKAFRALLSGQFDARSRLETWLYQIMTASSIDALRRRKTRAKWHEPEARDEARGVDGRHETEVLFALQELDLLMGRLLPEQRAAMILKYFEEMTSAEIAQVMQCSEGAVEQKLVRARTSLRAWSRQDA